MCGIVAYCGPARRSLAHELVRRLERLEYRGYDSAGVVSVASTGFNLLKCVGPVSVLSERLRPKTFSEAKVGMAHTRWATHGAVDERNAHPLVSASGRLTMVMNGVVENEAALRKVVASASAAPGAESDAAVLLALVEMHLGNLGGDLESACRAALREVEGRLALVLALRDQPDRLVIARRGSPLLVGVAGRSLWVVSDMVAFPETVDEALELQEDRPLSLVEGRLPSTGASLLRSVKVRRLPVQSKPPGKTSYFEKEIRDQETTVAEAVEAGLRLDALSSLDMSAVRRVVLVGCGSAYHACLSAKLAFEHWARLPAEAVVASELAGETALDRETLVVAASQSGETADTLAAAGAAVRAGAPLVALTNAPGSGLDRLGRRSLDLSVGAEVSVASTKAYTAMVVRLALMAAEAGIKRHALTAADVRVLAAEARALGRAVQAAAALTDRIEAVAKRWRDARAFLFVGRGFDYPAALEGALKLRELSYREATGLPAGELKHGTIALVESGYPVVAIALDRRVRQRTLAAVHEVRVRGADVLLLASEDDLEARTLDLGVLALPGVPDVWGPVVAAPVLQRLALAVSTELGRNVDRPRNLAKSVTVV